MAGSSREVVERYFGAWTSGDLDTARSLLHGDLSFRGPIDTFDNADDFSQALQRLTPIVTGARTRHVFADGDDVCVVYDLLTAPIPETPCAEWMHVRDGKIDSIELFFDARQFAAMFEQQPTGTTG